MIYYAYSVRSKFCLEWARDQLRLIRVYYWERIEYSTSKVTVMQALHFGYLPVTLLGRQNLIRIRNIFCIIFLFFLFFWSTEIFRIFNLFINLKFSLSFCDTTQSTYCIKMKYFHASWCNSFTNHIPEQWYALLQLQWMKEITPSNFYI